MKGDQVMELAWTTRTPTGRMTYEARRLSEGSRMWRVRSQHGESSMSTAELALELTVGLAEEGTNG